MKKHSKYIFENSVSVEENLYGIKSFWKIHLNRICVTKSHERNTTEIQMKIKMIQCKNYQTKTEIIKSQIASRKWLIVKQRNTSRDNIMHIRIHGIV